ncbi:MAG: 6-bladed beta-propeller [Bacteroidales bacterium]|nr:6-bladed beta-propeller [Bacteroidales bacterium]
MTITLFSCIQEEKTKNLRIIDLAGNVGKTSVVNLSEIAESVDYIPLETNDESLLAPPLTYLNFVNGKLYIRQFQTEIKIFNQDGSFVKVFNKQGRGPQEYEFLSDFYIDLLTNNLLVYTHKKLSEYNINGDFVRRISLYQKDEISIFGSNKYFKIEENLNLVTFSKYKSKYSSCVTDSLFNVLYYINYSDKDISTRLNIEKQINFLTPYFYKFRDSVRIFNGYGENILSVSNSKGVDTSFILNYGEYHYRNFNLNVRNSNNLPFIHRYRSVYESSNYLFMQFFMGSLPHKPKIILRYEREKNEKKVELPITASLFNKKTGQFQYVDQPEINQFGFVDDFEGGPAIWPNYISEQDFMVTIIDAYKFIQHAQTHKVSDKFKKIADGLKETDNPVVVLVKLKN